MKEKLMKKLFDILRIKKTAKDSDVDENYSVQPTTVVVPDPIENIVECKANAEEHNDFDVIINDGALNFRIKSSNSHEIVRLKCIEKIHEFGTVVDAYNGYYQFIKKISCYQYVKRLFVTDSKRFFYQMICTDNSIKYIPVKLDQIQKTMMIWENDSSRKTTPITDGSCSLCDGYWTIKPGTYDSSKLTCNGTYIYRCASYIDSYEIVNKEIYDTKLINIY